MPRYLPAVLTLATALVLAMAGCGSSSASHHAAATFHPYTATNSTGAAVAPTPSLSTGPPPGCSEAAASLHWALRHASEGLDAVIGHLKHVAARIPAGPLRTEVAKFGVALGLAAIYTQRGQPRQAAKMERAARIHAATVNRHVRHELAG